MSDLTLQDVRVTYGSRVAVADVSLAVPSGRRVALLGPSGCGKSSLLRAVAGIEPLAAGSVCLDGRDLAGLPTHRREIGLMFQDHALFPHLDVAGNVGFGLRMHRWPQPAARERVARMLELVGLHDRTGAGIHELSGGEQQRVALARTLAPEPRVVLLDEPLGSLDRVLRRDLLVTLVHAFDATAATVLYVTHDHEEAFRLADWVGVMRGGRLLQVSAPDELLAHPADGWVEDFLRD